MCVDWSDDDTDIPIPIRRATISSRSFARYYFSLFPTKTDIAAYVWRFISCETCDVVNAIRKRTFRFVAWEFNCLFSECKLSPRQNESNRRTVNNKKEINKSIYRRLVCWHDGSAKCAVVRSLELWNEFYQFRTRAHTRTSARGTQK